MGTNLSKVSFTAQVAPIMKRATATLSDGTAVAIVPDPNITTQTGADDVSGTPKIRVYKSSDTARTNWTLVNTFQTGVPSLCSATVPAILSMVLDSANNMHIVYAATDNSLRYVYYPFSLGSWGASTNQIVVAANAVSNRYRAVDIDVPNAGATANVAIIAYESKATNGPSAWIRLYCRRNDGTTWDNSFTEDQATLNGGSNNIYPNSEDVSISWGTTGITGNVGQILTYANRTGIDWDRGENLREFQWNTSTGGAATVLGTWTQLNTDIGTPFRRGWIFKTANNVWQVATVAGLTLPKFSVMRLTHGAYGPPLINTFGSGLNAHLWSSLAPTIYGGANPYNFLTCSYSDNRVLFGFITQSTPVHIASASSKALSMVGVVFRYDDISTYSASYNDTIMRPLDNYYQYGSQPIGIYAGGNNRGQSNDFKFNFIGLYGYAGNDTTGSSLNQARYILDTFYDAPQIIGPTASVANNTPTLQFRVQNSALYPNVKGKIEFQLARDSNFTTDLRTIAEPDANYRYFGSNTAQAPPPISISLKLSGVGSQKLYTGTWYMRARVVSDLGQASGWSSSNNFSVNHQPSALPVYPTPGSLVEYGIGNITFSWTYSDTEPTDTQTSYQLVIKRSDTGTTVYDSGKVSSSSTSATVNLAAANKDIPLQWSVSLWDTDNAQGPFSNPTLFATSDSPAIALNSPTNASTVTAAAPTVSWTYTPGGSRTQNAYRVYIAKPDNYDTFVRTAVAAGWSNSDSGVAWVNDANAAADYSTDGTYGKHNHAAVNLRKRSIFGQYIMDSHQRITVLVPVVATGGPIEAALIARRRDVNNYYYAGVLFNTDSTVTLFLGKRVGGTDSTISQVVLPGVTYTAGSKWDIRFSCIGSQLRVKAWSTGSQEHSYGYGLIAIDTSHTVTGVCGVTSNLPSTNTNVLPVAVSFDNYSKDDPGAAYVVDSGWLSGTVSSYTFASNVLANNSYYDIWLVVQDKAGMQVHTSSAVNTQWTHPALGNATVTLDDFGAAINWTNSGIDLSFISYRVYRRYMIPAMSDLDDNSTASTWVLVYETFDSAGPYSFKDYLIPLNKNVDYVVVQVADRYGSVIESNITAFTTVRMTADRYYFIPSIPIGTISSYEAAFVTDDSWTNEVEQSTLHIIGRGRQVQVGDDLGASGTLTIHLRNPTGARADREFIQRLASSKTINVWMKNPFGDVKYVRFGNVGVKFLAGTGLTEMSDLTVPYTEVFAPPVVVRSV